MRLKVLNTLLSNAVEQCETPEGPKRIRWGSERIKTWIRCDPGGPAEQFLTLVCSTFAWRVPLSYDQPGGIQLCTTRTH